MRSTVILTVEKDPLECKQIENHAPLSSWSTWLAEWIACALAKDDDDVADRGGHTPANRSTAIYSVHI